MKIKNKYFVIIGSAIFILYLIGPCIAAIFETGNRWGPKIYPLRYHEMVYTLTWEMTSHEAKKPRIGFWYDPDLRPWFYGMNSRNDDPKRYQSIIKKELEE